MNPGADLHLHSVYSEDSDASVESMVLAGIDAGLDTMCFTEHIDLDFPGPAGAWEADPAAYGAAISDARGKYADRIHLLFGAEFGMQMGLASRYEALEKKHGFDFILASVHLLDRKDPYYPEFWEGKEESSVIRYYFETILENIRLMDTYDSLAHLDYVVRYSPSRGASYHWEDHKTVIDEILTHIIHRDKALEINTSPYRKGFAYPNPCGGILQRYKDLGGRLITIGSDAHTPKDVAAGIEKAAALAKSTGFNTCQVFIGHEPHERPL